MQTKRLFSNWTQTATFFLIGGALAWATKLAIIVSTNGRIIDTGAAALFMRIGLLLLLVGSTAIGSRLSANRTALLRVLAIVLSPVILFGLFFLPGFFITPLLANSSIWYAQQEAPIAIAVVVSAVAGFILLKSLNPVAR